MRSVLWGCSIKAFTEKDMEMLEINR